MDIVNPIVYHQADWDEKRFQPARYKSVAHPLHGGERVEAELLREDQIGFGRPSLRPAGASMDKENRLLSTVLLAPLAGAALAGVRLWREKQKRRRP